MARISSYSQDPNLEAQDRLVGSDVSNANQTVNFSLASLGDFYTRSGLADATRLGYRFNYIAGDVPTNGHSIIPMGIYLGFSSSGTNFDNLNRVVISTTDVAGFSTSVLEDILQDGRIKLTSSRPAGQEVRAEGFFNVTGFEVLNNASGTVATALRLTVESAGAASSIGAVRTGVGVSEPDTDFVLVPLSPTAAGDVSGATRAWRAIEADSGTTAMPEGVEDTLDIAGGTGINTVVNDSTGPTATVTINHDTFGTTGTLTNSDNTFIQSITVDNGHITGVVTGQAAGMQTSQLAFPTLSGNVREAGFSGAAHSHTFTLSGTDGFTIDPALTNNVATLSENTIGTDTVTATWTATQTNLMAHTMAFSETRTLTTFRPFYTEIFNTVPTVFTFAPGKRVLQEVTSGVTIQLNPGALTNPEALIVVPNDDFPEQTRDSNDRYVSGVRFRTGGFLFIVPEAQFSVTGPSGTLYTAYVISLSPGSTLELEII